MANTPKNYTALLSKPVGDYQPKWHQEAHRDAMINPRPGIERALVRMIRGFVEYAETYSRVVEDTNIGDDHVIGQEWNEIGNCLRRILNGPTARLDCGTINSILYQIQTEESKGNAGLEVWQ